LSALAADAAVLLEETGGGEGTKSTAAAERREREESGEWEGEEGEEGEGEGRNSTPSIPRCGNNRSDERARQFCGRQSGALGGRDKQQAMLAAVGAEAWVENRPFEFVGRMAALAFLRAFPL
jgi:hypothetical protein